MPIFDIPTTVNALVTYFALGGTEAAVEVVKNMVNKISLTVEDFLKLKDDLQKTPEVAEKVKAFQQSPQDNDLQAQLKKMLTQKLEQHPTFQQNTAHVQGNIEADRGAVAVGANSGDIKINNTFK